MRNNNNREEGGEISVREAGKRGGETVKKKYGPEFYHEIGRKAHEEHPDLAHRAGKAGGQRVKELIEEGKESEESNRR